MNKGIRLAATLNSPANPFHLRACFFHCTPVSERRRRTHWDYGSSSNSSPRKFSQYRKRLTKQSMLHNVSEFAEHLFKSWQPDADEYIQPSDQGGSSWFRPNFREDASNKKGKSRNRNSRGARNFEFCDEDDYVDVEFETIFRSPFGGTRGVYYSFMDDGEPRVRSSSSYSNSNSRTSGRWKYEYEEEYYSSSDHYENKPTVDHMISDRLALGLSRSGPLNLGNVKNAYRACALKWHPDRHQGSSKVYTKVVAEEKFKVCCAAYQSLCDKLALH